MPFAAIEDPADFRPARPISTLGAVGLIMGGVGLALGCWPLFGFMVALPLAVIGACFSACGLVGAVGGGRTGWRLPTSGLALNLGIAYAVCRLTAAALTELD